MRAAHHRAHRGRAEVLRHDCWNHNTLFHALKTLLCSLVGISLVDAKTQEIGHRGAPLSVVFYSGSSRHIGQPIS